MRNPQPPTGTKKKAIGFIIIGILALLAACVPIIYPEISLPIPVVMEVLGSLLFSRLFGFLGAVFLGMGIKRLK